jgi:hypothetical protein
VAAVAVQANLGAGGIIESRMELLVYTPLIPLMGLCTLFRSGFGKEFSPGDLTLMLAAIGVSILLVHSGLIFTLSHMRTFFINFAVHCLLMTAGFALYALACNR